MQAEVDGPRSNAIGILCVIWAAGLLATVAVLILYLAVRSYDAALSCDDISAKAFTADMPPDTDAWDDWELVCGYY
jgi:hypothetical protein